MRRFRCVLVVLVSAIIGTLCQLAPAQAGPPPTGILKICKVAGPGVPLNTPFSFTISPAPSAPSNIAGTAFSLTAGPGLFGNCKFGTYPIGTLVTVQELLSPTTQIQSIDVPVPVPFKYLYGSPAFGQIAIKIGPNVQYAVYKNRTVKPGYIEICKDLTGPIPDPLPVFQFVVPGAGTLSVNATECSGPVQVASGMVTIHELTTSPYAAVACSAAPTPHTCAFDQGNQNATVDVAPGGITLQTITTVTNQGTPRLPCDLEISKTVAPIPLVKNQPGVATITLVNKGSLPCPGLTMVRDGVSNFGVSIGPIAANQPNWFCQQISSHTGWCSNTAGLPGNYAVTLAPIIHEMTRVGPEALVSGVLVDGSWIPASIESDPPPLAAIRVLSGESGRVP